MPSLDLKLIPDRLPAHLTAIVRKHQLASMLAALESQAHEARVLADHAADQMARAGVAQRAGSTKLAESINEAAKTDHKRACARAHEAAMTARSLIIWALGSFRPSPGVAGSGLTSDELTELCEVVGLFWDPTEVPF